MSEPARKKATYEDLYAIPENMTGQIINGELIVNPRHSTRHSLTATALSGRLTPPYLLAKAVRAGGSFSTKMKSCSEKIFSSPTFPAGEKSGSPECQKKTGFQFLRIGYVKSSHLVPPA
jgi:hypothetical protein